jgi:hypothetical protein
LLLLLLCINTTITISFTFSGEHANNSLLYTVISAGYEVFSFLRDNFHGMEDSGVTLTTHPLICLQHHH